MRCISSIKPHASSSSSLLFWSCSSSSLIIHLSFCSCFSSKTAASTIWTVPIFFSHFPYSVCSTCLSFLLQWFPLRPSPQRSLSTFLEAEKYSTYRESSGRRLPRLAVAIGILFFSVPFFALPSFSLLGHGTFETAVVFIQFRQSHPLGRGARGWLGHAVHGL